MRIGKGHDHDRWPQFHKSIVKSQIFTTILIQRRTEKFGSRDLSLWWYILVHIEMYGMVWNGME
jgi:hypothetical protein